MRNLLPIAFTDTRWFEVIRMINEAGVDEKGTLIKNYWSETFSGVLDCDTNFQIRKQHILEYPYYFSCDIVTSCVIVTIKY